MSFLLMQRGQSKIQQANLGELFWPVEVIAAITGAPIENLRTYWFPLAGLIPQSKKSHIAALANGATEVGTFEPINEYGSDDYFWRMYDITSPDANRRQVARDLGNIYPGDGVLYHGRGIIQLTGRSNYQRYGKRLGIPLEDNPDLALQANVSAQVFALFMYDHGTFDAAEWSDWLTVRRSVNGGTNGWNKFIGIVNGLLAS